MFRVQGLGIRAWGLGGVIIDKLCRKAYIIALFGAPMLRPKGDTKALNTFANYTHVLIGYLGLWGVVGLHEKPWYIRRTWKGIWGMQGF